MEYEETRVLR